MLRKILPLFVALFFCATLPALAQEGKQEKKIREVMEQALKTKVTSITKAGYLDLYEVFVNGEIYYVDGKVNVIIAGNLIDTKGMRNVTAERLTKLSAIKFSDLPLAQAVKQVRGDGKRVVASFEDPNCGYCKRLAQEMLKIDNVTHYVFLVPILSEDSNIKSRQIWCASDRAKTWNDWVISNKAPTGNGDCDTSAIDRNTELGRKLSVNGTPTMFFADGERVTGALPSAQIEEKLNQLAK